MNEKKMFDSEKLKCLEKSTLLQCPSCTKYQLTNISYKYNCCYKDICTSCAILTDTSVCFFCKHERSTLKPNFDLWDLQYNGHDHLVHFAIKRSIEKNMLFDVPFRVESSASEVPSTSEIFIYNMFFSILYNNIFDLSSKTFDQFKQQCVIEMKKNPFSVFITDQCPLFGYGQCILLTDKQNDKNMLFFLFHHIC